MILLRLALKSAWNRRISLGLTVLSLAISIMLLLGVDMIRKEAKANFVNTISRTDLIVGARGGPINLLLYSIFHLGDATNNVSWASYKEISNLPQIDWSVPISLGDSHRGYRVVGTSQDFFKRYRYAGYNKIEFEKGRAFDGIFEVVIGADIADKLNYKLGQKLIISHGLVSTGFADHDDKPFTIVGILERSGTPVDRSLLVSLEGISAIHVDWQSGRRSAIEISAEKALKLNLQPTEITAFLIGLKKRVTTFRVQRKINEYAEEPLTAIVPGSTLANLWKTLSSFEKVLLGISMLVVMAGLTGMLTTVISSLNERRREMAVLRAVGAHPYHIIFLFMLETLLLMLAAIVLGVISLYGLLLVAKPLLIQWMGINIQIVGLDLQQIVILLAVTLIALLISLIPGIIAYRRSLQDGLMARV